MAHKRAQPEKIVSKLRHVDVLMGQRMPRLDALRQMGLFAACIAVKMLLVGVDNLGFGHG